MTSCSIINSFTIDSLGEFVYTLLKESRLSHGEHLIYASAMQLTFTWSVNPCFAAISIHLPPGGSGATHKVTR